MYISFFEFCKQLAGIFFKIDKLLFIRKPKLFLCNKKPSRSQRDGSVFSQERSLFFLLHHFILGGILHIFHGRRRHHFHHITG